MIDSWYGQVVGLGLWAFIGLGILAVVLAVAIVVLKGMALWHAAKRDEKGWFIVLLVVNTLGILELIYLIAVVKKWNKGTSTVSSGTNQTPPAQF